MPIEDVVRWLRGEHDGLPELADGLRERIVKPPRGDRRIWVQELRQRFDEFAACLRRRCARREEGGYLNPVREARPSLAAQVAVLEHEHGELKLLIDKVERAVHQLSPTDNLLMRDCCKRVELLLGWLERHEEHENHILLYAFARESGRQTPAGSPARDDRR
jgi:hemerythrin-like domain-containing protein